MSGVARGEDGLWRCSWAVGPLYEAYHDDEKAMPSTRDVRLRDVNEQFLESLKRGVLYRVRR